jgi:hypothetical protein
LSPTLPNTVAELQQHLTDTVRILGHSEVDGQTDGALMAQVGSEQYQMSKSHSGQLICAYNTGRLLTRLYHMDRQYRSAKRLADALQMGGFGEKNVRSYMTFAKQVDELKCYKLLYCLHDLSWAQISRHVTSFFELVVKHPSDLFQLQNEDSR